jgi:hypothetical protein
MLKVEAGSRENKRSCQKRALNKVIDLCDEEDDKTVEYLSSSGESSESIESDDLGRNKTLIRR